MYYIVLAKSTSTTREIAMEFMIYYATAVESIVH